MDGSVSSNLEAIVRLTLIGVGHREEEIDASIDTAFTGHLTLPSALLAGLGWPFSHEEEVELGDASDAIMRLYRGIVIWDGNPRLVSVAATESMPLIGTAMLSGSMLRIEFKPGGQVSVLPLP
jgi:clan AA aspartic protease